MQKVLKKSSEPAHRSCFIEILPLNSIESSCSTPRPTTHCLYPASIYYQTALMCHYTSNSRIPISWMSSIISMCCGSTARVVSASPVCLYNGNCLQPPAPAFPFASPSLFGMFRRKQAQLEPCVRLWLPAGRRQAGRCHARYRFV